MRLWILMTSTVALLAAATLTGCNGQRGSSDPSSMHSTVLPSAAEQSPAGRGVEDPHG